MNRRFTDPKKLMQSQQDRLQKRIAAMKAWPSTFKREFDRLVLIRNFGTCPTCGKEFSAKTSVSQRGDSYSVEIVRSCDHFNIEIDSISAKAKIHADKSIPGLS